MKARTLDEKQAEQQRLSAAYRAAKREQWASLCEQEPRLAETRLAIRRETCPATLLRRLGDSWARRAPAPIRYATLRIIQKHSERMQRQQGAAVLDDPLPPARNLYLAAKEMLAVR